MRVADFDYELPPELVAQEPVEPRDAARLLVARGAGTCEHRAVRDLPELLAPGDLLLVNDTRVRPARLFARRASGGRVELVFLEPASDGHWWALARPARKLAPGEVLEAPEGARLELLERRDESEGPPTWRVACVGAPAIEELLERHGRMPLPPYVRRAREGDRRDARDREHYQTVFARHSGAVAAPTAGLHFTPQLLARLEARGVARAALTLHVGMGTFRPVTAQDTRDHVMHAEEYELPVATAEAVEACRARGRRVVAVGTTSVRVLESCADPDGRLTPGRGRTRIFIEPGHRFRSVDALLTNFHLPRSTLLMLVAAFAGRERVLELYREAVARGYRFYSYGDAMLLLP